MKVLLIDDHPLILAALQAVIRGLGDDVEVIGVDSARGARERLQADPGFDLVLLDLQLGDADGFEVLTEFRSAYPDLPVVVVSASDRTADVIRSIDIGAMGFIPKRSSNDALLEALRMVMVGGIYVPPMTMGFQPVDAPPAPRPAADSVGHNASAGPFQTQAPLAALGLTPRQTEVMALLLQGKPNKLIARELKLSVETVKDHVAAVLRSLNVSSRTQAVLAVSQMAHQPGGPDQLAEIAAVSAGGAAAAAAAVPAAGPGRAPPAGAAMTAPATAMGPRSPLPDEVRSAYEFMPATVVGNLTGIAIVLVLFWHAAPAALLGGWLAAYAVMLLLRLLLLRRFHAADPRTLAQWQRWRLWWNAGTLTSAAMWGATAWLFYLRGNSVQQSGLIITVYTFCAVAVPVLATQPRLFMLFSALCYLPLGARIASAGTGESYQLAGILFLIFATTSVLARAYRQALRRAIDLKLQADEMALQLRAEKQAADTARHQAEVANRAKTQFFAAASHDLRQPLHAMGLFAEALRSKSHDDEVAHLVNSINGSVDALESLFSELLDITRIDSGGIEVHPAHFAVGDLQRKLRLGFEPNAFEKGLALRFRGARHLVHADPLLVERILRNLVSNAIRYTHDGSVLVSCRRRGERLLLQVWDTGPGIGAAEQQRIFEEFYQVQSTERISPEQRKGLGLGLAIVKRLAALLEAPLTLSSRPGHGSVFTLELPPGKAVPASQAVPPRKGPLGITLAGRLIVLVEDEPAVLAGLEVLLKGWGATLVTFDSVAACSAWAAAADPAQTAPDLLIVDYRLEPGRTGIDAIRAVRARFGRGVPAIVVTGSTMSGHENEAQADDFHLLIKPVVPNKLRAMIAFKLGVKAA